MNDFGARRPRHYFSFGNNSPAGDYCRRTRVDRLGDRLGGAAIEWLEHPPSRRRRPLRAVSELRCRTACSTREPGHTGSALPRRPSRRMPPAAVACALCAVTRTAGRPDRSTAAGRRAERKRSPSLPRSAMRPRRMQARSCDVGRKAAPAPVSAELGRVPRPRLRARARSSCRPADWNGRGSNEPCQAAKADRAPPVFWDLKIELESEVGGRGRRTGTFSMRGSSTGSPQIMRSCRSSQIACWPSRWM